MSDELFLNTENEHPTLSESCIFLQVSGEKMPGQANFVA